MTKITDADLLRIMDAENNMWQGVLDGSIENVNQSSRWGIHKEDIFLTCNKQAFEAWLLENYPLREYESKPQGAEFFIDLVKFEFVCLRDDNVKYRYSFVITEPSNQPQVREQLLREARNTFETSGQKTAQVGAEIPLIEDPTDQKESDKMTEETKNKFIDAYHIYLTMCEEYKGDVLDGASQNAKPSIQDFRARVISEMNWKVGDRRLRDVITYGKANLNK